MTIGAVLKAKAGKHDPEPVYWISEPPAVCELCGQKIKETFADARTVQGPWGSLDLKCLRIHGVGVGKGKGQVYRRQDDGRWLKVEG
jgi:hypothetical protein